MLGLHQMKHSDKHDTFLVLLKHMILEQDVFVKQDTEPTGNSHIY